MPAVAYPKRFGWLSSGVGAVRHAGEDEPSEGAAVRYVMVIAGDESHWYDEAVASGLMEEVNAWWDKWHQAGKIELGGAELQHSRTAKTVSAGRDGQPTVTDGPY